MASMHGSLLLELRTDPLMIDTTLLARHLTSRLGVKPYVTFAGHVDNPEAWLQGIDVFVSNSLWEGQQVALLEALASGCYCLSHTWDGANEVLPADQLFTRQQELVEKIVEYNSLPTAQKLERRRSMRAIAEEKFDENRQIGQIREVA